MGISALSTLTTAGVGVGMGVATIGAGAGMTGMTAGVGGTAIEEEVVGSFWVFVGASAFTNGDSERRCLTLDDLADLEGTMGFSLSSQVVKGEEERLAPLVWSLLAEALNRGLRRMDSSVVLSPLSLNAFLSPPSLLALFAFLSAGATRWVSVVWCSDWWLVGVTVVTEGVETTGFPVVIDEFSCAKRSRSCCIC